MKKQDINTLIEKYYDGSLSSEEELFLKNYLENNHEPEYNLIRSQLQIMKDISTEENDLDSSFDKKLLQEISATNNNKTRRYYLQRILSGVAATALILISIWVVTSMLTTKEAYGTISDSHAAFAETKKILQKVSGNFNKGVKPVSKTIEKAEAGLDKSKKVNKIKKLNNAGLLLKSMNKVTVNFGKS